MFQSSANVGAADLASASEAPVLSQTPFRKVARLRLTSLSASNPKNNNSSLKPSAPPPPDRRRPDTIVRREYDRVADGAQQARPGAEILRHFVDITHQVHRRGERASSDSNTPATNPKLHRPTHPNIVIPAPLTLWRHYCYVT